MVEHSDFRARQYEFAAHLRDPDKQAAPGDVEDRRMAIYRDLFFNNVRNLLAGNFPVIVEILGEERWTQLVRDFYRDHKSRSPLFADVPKEFLHYLLQERSASRDNSTDNDPPFLYELAHYEWVEAGLLLAEDPEPVRGLRTDGSLLDELPILSDLAWLLSYTFPVNEIGKAYQPAEPAEQPLYYLVYRDSADEVKFIKLNAVSARLFEVLRNTDCATGAAALAALAAELQHPEPQKVTAAGATILEQWRNKGIVQGTVHYSE